MELLARIQAVAEEHPGRVAVVAGAGGKRQELTYGELCETARRIATRLCGQGEGRLALLATSRGRGLVAALVGSLWAGVPCAPIDLTQSIHRTRAILRQAPGSLLVADESGVRYLARMGLATETEVLTLEDLAASRQTHGEPIALASAAERPAVVLFTSGSTGEPKGVLIARSDLDQRLAAEQAWFGLGVEDRILGVLPLTFDVGLTQLLGSLYAGGTHILGESWLPIDIVQRIRDESATGLALAPAVWGYLLQTNRPEQVWSALGGLKYVTLSGGSLPASELETIMGALRGARFIRTYGQTEMFRIAALDASQHPSKLASVGRAYPGVALEVRLADGSPAGPGELGEVFAGGLGRMVGYWGAAPEPELPEGALHATADLGFLDEDGFLHLRGRKDDMIKILDRRIFPAEIAALCRSALGDATIEVVSIARPDTFVVAFTTAQLSSFEAADRLVKLRREVGSLLAPRALLSLVRMPTTSTGKVDYAELRRRALAAGEITGGGDGRG